MKYRTGFVSNSSSSSFVCALNRLTDEQLTKLLAYPDSPENTDGWDLRIDNEAGLVTGFTIMDNCALSDWCRENGITAARFEGD